MKRRKLTVLCLLSAGFGAVASAASCYGASSADSVATDSVAKYAQDGSPRVAPANAPVSGAAGTDAPAPAPLPPYPPAEVAEQRRLAAERAAARRRAVAHRGTTEGGTASFAPGPVAEPATVTLPTQAQQAGSMLIRSGQAVVEVDSVQVGIARVRRLAQESGALVANTSIQAGREQRRSASLELRIPSDRFDAVVNGLPPIGKVESVNISAQDVGEEFVDLTARVANARRLEARLIELLASRTGRLADVLAVESQLARVREQIERYEGRLRYLQSHVAVSSLTVTVHEPAPVVAVHPGQNVIGEAFVEAWRRFVLLTAGLIASLGVVVPVGALGVGAFLLGRRYLVQKPRVAEQA